MLCLSVECLRWLVGSEIDVIWKGYMKLINYVHPIRRISRLIADWPLNKWIKGLCFDVNNAMSSVCLFRFCCRSTALTALTANSCERHVIDRPIDEWKSESRKAFWYEKCIRLLNEWNNRNNRKLSQTPNHCSNWFTPEVNQSLK